jgi:hypothetical protein
VSGTWILYSLHMYWSNAREEIMLELRGPIRLNQLCKFLKNFLLVPTWASFTQLVVQWFHLLD